MRKIILFTLLACFVALAGCSKDAAIDSFIAEFEGVTQEMTKNIEAGDVDAAKKAFDDKKASLKSSWDEIKGARGFQVTEESKTKLMESVTKNMSALTSSIYKGSSKLAGDQQKAEDLKNLLEEYKNVFQM